MALVSTATVSSADTKTDCAKAYEASQEQKSNGRLRDARQSLVTCSQSACPAFIKKDCAKWLNEVEGAIPTVVFSAKAGSDDVIDVKVSLGDEVLAESLDGKAVQVDPGTHIFVFESPRFGKKDVKVVVKEGQKSQSVLAELKPEKKDSDTAPTHDDGSTKVTPEDVKGNKTVAYVLAGVGVVGLGAFAYFGLSGKSDQNGLKCADSKTCKDSDIDPIKKKYLYADISLGVGLVSLGVATYLLMSGPSKKERSAAKSHTLHFDVAPARGGGFATVGAEF